MTYCCHQSDSHYLIVSNGLLGGNSYLAGLAIKKFGPFLAVSECSTPKLKIIVIADNSIDGEEVEKSRIRMKIQLCESAKVGALIVLL